jgi:amino acid transporter
MSKISPLLSREEIIEQTRSNKLFYNNTQNVEEPKINALLSNSDEQLLAEIGYKPELKRHFSLFQVFGISFSIMAILPLILSILADGLTGGPAGCFWGWVISSMFILTIGVSMSENGSSQPTSGGLYYWTNFYAPARAKTVISYLIGNTNSIALIGGLCSVDYGFAQELLSVIVIATDGEFNITAAKTYGVFVACVLSHIILTCASSKNCAWLQTSLVVLNTTIVVLFLVALPIGAKGNFKTASYVFTEFNNFSDWPSGWTQVSSTWLLGIWTLGAFDSVIHMSEEIPLASTAIPIGIIGSLSACIILGIAVMLVTLFCIQTNDIEGHIIGSKFGQPMAQIIYDCLGKKWAISFMILIAIGQFLMGASILTAISRQIWAFSRDNGLPFSSWIKKVNVKLSVPIRAVCFGGFGAILIGLLCLIGPTAANALFTLYIAGNYVAWGTPTFLRLTFGRNKFQPGKFYLGGVFSPLIGWTSTVFILYTVVMVMLPSTKYPDKETMNYTCIITPSVWIFSLVYYKIYAHKHYHGPQKTVHVSDCASENDMDRIYTILDGVEVNSDKKSRTYEKLDFA